MAACEVAIDLGAHGPVTASALACASGNYALLEARRLILAGEADVVVAGGTDAGISEAMFAGLANMGPLSVRNDEPEKASRPFDPDRDGFVFGEGAVVLVVESAEHARARGARPYGDGRRWRPDERRVPHQRARAQRDAGRGVALRLALERTGTAPEDVDYICAHGTGTRANDLPRRSAIRAAFGAAADAVPASSPKSMVGHLIGAAGALSAMVCLLAMRDGMLPPTINLDTPDPACDLDYVPLHARPATCGPRSPTRSASAGRTASWCCARRRDDKVRCMTVPTDLSGCEYLEAIRDERVAAPPMARLLGFELTTVGDGDVTFTGIPPTSRPQPEPGTVHGGIRRRPPGLGGRLRRAHDPAGRHRVHLDRDQGQLPAGHHRRHGAGDGHRSRDEARAARRVRRRRGQGCRGQAPGHRAERFVMAPQ